MYNIYFEVAAVGFMGILLLYLHIEYPKASESNVRYRQWVTWILLSLIVDVVATRMTDYGYMIPPIVNILVSTFYFIITAGSFWGLGRYFHSIIKGKFSDFYMQFLNVLSIIYSIFFIINIFTGWVFTYDDSGAYIHGPYYFVIFIFQAICHILSIALLISNRKKLEKRLLVSIWLFMVFIIAGYILQVVFFQKTLLVFYMFSLAAMTALFVIETPDYLKLSEALKEVEDQKRRADVANNAKSEFLAKMSHEIRTPINAVIGMDEMILRDGKDKTIKGYAFDIKNAAEALLSTINDILDLSKVESGKMELVPIDYDVSSMFHDVSNMIEFRAKEKNLKFIVDIDSNIPSRLFGDDVRLRQIMVNLLTNAVKYTEKGSVTFTVSSEIVGDDCTLHISVKDTGMGIKEEDKDKLFEQYARLDEEKNRHIEGTGLGMSITLQLLNLMDSKLNVESTYGEGSEFYFDVTEPIMDKTPIGSLKERIAEQNNSYDYKVSFTAPNARILLVDDNYMNRKVARSLLRDTRIRVDEAAGGYECIECVKEMHYDVILLDHMMPDLDGIETLRIMRDNNMYKCKDTPVVALTANMVAGAKEMYEEEGFDSFLGKPIRPERLEEMLRELIPDELIEEEDYSADSELVDISDVNNMGNAHSDDIDENRDLVSIEGIDYEDALRHLGSETLVINTMRDFCKQSVIDGRKLNSWYENITENADDKESLNQYKILVHSMKNSSAMIGARTVTELARVLEYAAGDNRVDIIRNMHTVYIEELYRLKERIKEAYSFDDELTGVDNNEDDGIKSDGSIHISNEKDSKKSVLIIDDSPSMLSSMKAILNEQYKVTVITSGEQAVRLLNKRKQDIILLDYLMPTWDGIRTLEEIRNMSDCKDIPVLFLTGASDDEALDLETLDVSGVVRKPPVAEELFEKIEKYTTQVLTNV